MEDVDVQRTTNLSAFAAMFNRVGNAPRVLHSHSSQVDCCPMSDPDQMSHAKPQRWQAVELTFSVRQIFPPLRLCLTEWATPLAFCTATHHKVKKNRQDEQDFQDEQDAGLRAIEGALQFVLGIWTRNARHPPHTNSRPSPCSS